MSHLELIALIIAFELTSVNQHIYRTVVAIHLIAVEVFEVDELPEYTAVHHISCAYLRIIIEPISARIIED